MQELPWKQDQLPPKLRQRMRIQYVVTNIVTVTETKIVGAGRREYSYGRVLILLPPEFIGHKVKVEATITVID